MITSSIDIYSAGIAGVVVIGFIGDIIARKTGLPAIVWLLAFGIILGPVLGILPASLLINLSPIVSTLVLLIIIFNAGLRLNIYQFVRSLSQTTILAVVNFIVSALLTAIAMYAFGFSQVDAILMGVIVGGTSAAVIPIISKSAPMSSQSKNLVTVESILTDPIGIVLTLAIINIIILNNYSIGFVVSTVAANFSIAIVFGALAGIVWVPIMGYLQTNRYEYSYAGSIAAAFIIFILVQYINGSGPIAALVFGIILANGETIYKEMKYENTKNFTLSKESKRFNSLVTFFTGAFFFVYLGGLVSFSNPYSFLIGVAITAALIIARFIGTPVALMKSQYNDDEKFQISYMVSRGMGAGVLATLPLAYGIAGTGQFINIIFTVIILTILFNSISSLYFSIKQKRTEAKIEQIQQAAAPHVQ